MSVRTEKNGEVTTIINDRINARNAVDPETADALTAAFLAFDSDRTAKVAVFYGEGGAFCAGWDLKYAGALSEREQFRTEIMERLAFPGCHTGAAWPDGTLAPGAFEAGHRRR